PFVFDLVEPAQEELTESSRLFDLSEDRLGQLLAETVATAVPAELELAAHRPGERAAHLPADRRALGLACGDVGGNLTSLKPSQVRLGAVAGIGRDLLGLLAIHVLSDRVGERDQARGIG